MAVRPHVSFTLYDETALSLHRLTRLSFEHVLTGQQFLYRALGLIGIYLFATAAGLHPLMAWLTTAVLSLGANVMGPAVLVMEYEPVPRGFALPFVIFSLAMVARGELRWAAVAATIGFAFHPPTTFAYAAILGLVLLWRKDLLALGLLAIGPLLIVITILIQPAAPRDPSALWRDRSISRGSTTDASFVQLGRYVGRQVDVVLRRAMDSRIHGMETGTRELHSRSIGFPAVAAFDRDDIRSAVVLAVGTEEIGPHAPISARPVPAVRDSCRDDTRLYRRCTRGGAKALLRNVRIFRRAPDRHRRRMGHGEVDGTPTTIGMCSGSAGCNRGDPTVARMAGCDRRIYSVLCVPRNCRDSELPSDTLRRIRRPCKVGSKKHFQRCCLSIRRRW